LRLVASLTDIQEVLDEHPEGRSPVTDVVLPDDHMT
jgi:hypothetical protein